MKIELELNLMGIFYILVACCIIAGAVVAFVVSTGFITTNTGNLDGKTIWVNGALFITLIVTGVIGIGLLVPVVRRIFKAFMQ